MADKKEIELIFKGVDQTGAATDAALGNVQKFSTGLQNAAAPIANFTKDMAKIELALLATSSAIVAFSVKAAGDFDSAFREIATLIDLPLDELDDFRRSIQDYALTSTSGLSDITAAVYSAISAGVDYTESLDVVAKAEQLAVAGKSTLKEALLALEGPLNAYGASAEEAGDFADVLFAAVREGITTIPELSDNLSKAIPIASAAGVSFSDLNAVVAALTANGMGTAEAVTAVTGVMTGIIRPTDQAARAADELGIEFGVGAMQAQGFSDYMFYLGDAIDGNIEVAAQLFGNIRGLSGVMSLAGEGVESYNRALEGQEQRNGAVAEAFEKMADSISFSNQRIVNTLQGIAIEIGDPLLEAYGGVADALAAVFIAIGTSVREGELGGIVEYIQSVFFDVEGILLRLAENLPLALKDVELDGFQRNVDAVREGISKLLDGYNLDSPEGLARMIQIINDAIGQLGEFVGGTIGSFELFLSTIVGAVENVGRAAENFNKLAGAVGGFAFQLGVVLPALDTVLLALIAARGGGLVAAAKTAAGTVTALAGALGPTTLVAAAGAGGYAVGSVLASGIDAVVNRLTDSGSLGGLIYDVVHQTERWTGTSELLERQLQAVAREAAETAKAAAKVAEEDAAFDRLWDAVTSGISVFQTLDEALSQAVDGQRVFFDEALGGYAVLDHGVRAFAEGVGDANADIEEQTKSLAEWYKEQGYWLDEATGKVIPYADSYEYLQNNMQDTLDATDGFIETTKDGVTTFEQFGRTAGTAYNDAKQSAEDAFKASETYLLKMEEIASNERIANIQASVSINVAQIESETQRVQSAFDSINNTISSTGDVLQTLYGAFLDAGNAWDQMKIERWIEDENRRRDEALDMQKDLVQAEIDLLKSRRNALDRGDAQITINGDGLAPHLEGFMWEVIRRVQMRVNQDGLEMLLGAA